MKTQEIAPVVCPQCQTRYNASIVSIVDVTAHPELKNAFLRGQLNVSQCPQCGFQAELNLPMLYHDTEKTLALVMMPASLHLSHVDEQKIIGDLTNKLINILPAEQRKAYIFTPKTFLTPDSMRKAILEADGITEEMMAAQAAKARLLDRMLRAKDEAELRGLVAEHDAELDRQFFEIVSAMAFNALGQGQQDQGQFLLAFRQLVSEMSSQGAEIVAQIDQEMGVQALTPERLLESLLQAEHDAEFAALIQAARPMIDYSFFQALTGQIEALQAVGNKTEAQRLKTLRSRILDVSAQIEDEERKHITQASQLLSQLVQAPDPNSFIKQNLPHFDDVFFMVLANHIQAATQNNQKEMAERLSNLHNRIAAAIDEQMPPELKLLSQLMQAESPEAIKPILEQRKAEITPRFMELLDRAINDLKSKGQHQMAGQIEVIKAAAAGVKQTSSIILP